ncbi:GNAT family N-acetyltransferase [Vibrio harveyi]|uniref:GNAT family N-acetyltransferase n=2 Tax=Vibrio harveyi TaxID=669 RepID=UPI0003A58DDE|nr:GNAT family N-acetyltransferase [Vibrio harveyi]MBY7699036.1 GNAT family N-acetyltransferase [Vibrio harveyi]PNM62865.1 N-acetyltransferase [Vibrio harveyi]SQA35245.1 Acetyltransferase (GNAT) family [Vibrio harveyi]
MKSLTFTSYQDSHFHSCVDLVMSTWNLHSGFVNVPNIRIVYEHYLTTCLNWNHHLDVVLDPQGKVVGVLFASKENISYLEELKFAKKDKKLNKWKNKNLAAGNFGEKESAKKVFSGFLRNDCAGEQDAAMFDGEINLFIVSVKLRGRGIGSLLLERYVKFCRTNELKKIFLWTDLTCNYKFYLNQGFTLHKRFKTYSTHQEKSNIPDGMILSLDINAPRVCKPITNESHNTPDYPLKVINEVAF